MGLSQFEEKAPWFWINPVPDSSTPNNVYFAINAPTVVRVDRLIAATDDTADILLHLQLDDGFSDVCTIGSILVPALSGYDPTIPPVDLLAAVMGSGVGIVLGLGMHLQVNVPVALTSGKFLWLSALGGYL